jgi:hypothetical protein
VVDVAWERWGTVLPATFDIIFRGADPGDAEQTVKKWLTAEYDNLRAKLARVSGKAEYGVQVFWDARSFSEGLTQNRRDLAALTTEMKSKAPGTAYLHRERLRVLLRRELEMETARRSQGFYRATLEHVQELRLGTLKKGAEGLEMILNLSCLATREQALSLGQELEHVGQGEGMLVRFTGPWPPYSFVGSS